MSFPNQETCKEMRAKIEAARKHVVKEPLCATIRDVDGKIVERGLLPICPWCGEVEYSHAYGFWDGWHVGAEREYSCSKCRQPFTTISLSVPPDMTPNQLYEWIAAFYRTEVMPE